MVLEKKLELGHLSSFRYGEINLEDEQAPLTYRSRLLQKNHYLRTRFSGEGTVDVPFFYYSYIIWRKRLEYG